MKILKISGRNLASLAGDFCVDFEQEPLASSGLFAISGPTGAGKSTLLDALCLALYDATPRLLRIVRGGSLLPDVGDDAVSATDPRNLLRRGTSEAWAEVDFIGSEQLRYRARWSVRRSRGKVGGRLQDTQVTLLRVSDQAPLGGTKTETLREIEQRVGLSFEQFTRAVLLAQNEFSAFLKTEENERGALLETLTGSAIYSVLSRRAYERFKFEEGVTLELSRQLANVTPLDGAARAALDADSAAADAALAALDVRQGLLDAQLRWHDEARKLDAAETEAAQALALRQASLQQAAPRHQQLARLDALQGARAPHAECARLDKELAATRAAAPTLAQRRAEAESAWQAASAQAGGAALALQAAEQAAADAAPALDRAKALDAAIGVLAPAQRQAQQASASAAAQSGAAQQALREKEGQLAAMHSARLGAADWLSRHQPWEALAAQWPRWDALFDQAQEAGMRADAIGAALRQADAALAQANQAEQAAAADLARAAATVQTLEAARQQAFAALAGFDPERLRAGRRALEERRAALAGAHAIWQTLGEAEARQRQLLGQSAAVGAELAGAEAALAAALGAEPALAAALAQAERSLSGAELACAASVADLRATLADGAPCPVCGSAEHPYQHRDEALRQILASLRAEVAGCHTALRANLAASASARTLSSAAAAQLRTCAAEMALQAARLEQARSAWGAEALAQEDGIDGAWFGARGAALAAELEALEQQDGALRRASLARDNAQSACDQAAAAHTQLQQTLGGARTRQAQAGASRASLAQQHIDAQAAPAGPLRELDGALAEHWPDWRDAWRADPAAFRAARAAEAAQWQEQASAQAARAGSIAALQAAHGAAAELAEQRALDAAAASAALARLDGELAAMRAQRAVLWDGSPVAQVEQALAQAMAQARAALAGAQDAQALAASAAERARSALAAHQARLAQLEREALAAQAILAPWRAAYPDLAELLDCSQAWMAEERRALQALASAAEQAATVLEERRARRSAHAALDPQVDRDGVVEALEALGAACQAAQDSAGALRLRRALDDERRNHARAVLAEIEEQQLIERRWGRMSELIGSADGKKFRNYAQQFTLDVLLGYANSHLAQLARRYRLERVASASGPSLSLLVRDQDMGGEIRSVNSLSGGESFLVSLALALGLASLSSNRVRVESLFIDEGFGSLDSETLRVAMDALDGLQSMGRKVGVISHVQEMTERIAARIVVRPNGGGSSSVAVE